MHKPLISLKSVSLPRVCWVMLPVALFVLIYVAVPANCGNLGNIRAFANSSDPSYPKEEIQSACDCATKHYNAHRAFTITFHEGSCADYLIVIKGTATGRIFESSRFLGGGMGDSEPGQVFPTHTMEWSASESFSEKIQQRMKVKP